jgi:DNA replication and repair protein RecF
MLTNLSLFNFRNHEERSFELSPQTVITGRNGVGKTNILEAVAMLCWTTSWKTDRDSEVVAWDAPFARIIGGDRELVIQRHPYYKRIRVDGLSKRASEVLGTMPATLFQPDDSALVHGAPAYRRLSLDRLLSQTNVGYSRSLTQLQRIVKQRNKLLKQLQEGNASTDELSYWDAELATHSDVVKHLRKEALPILSATVNEVFKELIPEDGPVTLEYQESPRGGVESLLHHLQNSRGKEIAAGMTLYGPHREDIIFMWGEHLAAECMSRGQSRALVIAFKVAELRYIEGHSEVKPLLLLDDVFSEFDSDRRQVIVELMGQYQTIMTTTDLDDIKKKKDLHVIAL